MHVPDASAFDAAFCERVKLLCERVEPTRALVEPGWSSVAQHLFPDPALTDPALSQPGSEADPVLGTVVLSRLLVVGAPAFVLSQHLGGSDRLAVVSPSSFSSPFAPWAKRGRGRSQRWTHRDLTTQMWRHGWSAIAVDRMRLQSAGATIEFVIAEMRRTPRSNKPRSALDDAD